jgi:hypothetical protein
MVSVNPYPSSFTSFRIIPAPVIGAGIFIKSINGILRAIIQGEAVKTAFVGKHKNTLGEMN